MRLGIADPPYLGRGHRWYGGGRGSFKHAGTRADVHPEASEWDDPHRHHQLLDELEAGFDGYAVALSADSLGVYMSWNPLLRPGIWHRPNSMPDGSRILNRFEVVLFKIPGDRLGRASALTVSDVLVEGMNSRSGFVGSKPAAWTRWVLAMLGHQPDDEVVDLFPGSGRVAREIGALLPIPTTGDENGS